MTLESSTAASGSGVARPLTRATETTRTSRPIRRVCEFVGLSLLASAVAGGAALAGIASALLPFALAFTPAVIALALARREGTGAARRLAHSVTIRPARARWYFALLIPVLATLAVVPLAVALGAPSTNLFAAVAPAIFIVPIVVLIPAFAEELGWRGYALPRLGTAVSPLAAGLLLGIPWAAIHLVLFLPGQMFEGIAVWPSIVSVMSLSVICAWLFVGTGGSVLMTGLFHALFNGATPLMSGVDPDMTWPLRALVIAGVAAAIVILGGFRNRAWPRASAG